MDQRIHILKDTLKNIFDKSNSIVYISEPGEWVIKVIGKEITKSTAQICNTKITIRSTSFGLKNKILHFGSVNTLINERGVVKTHKSNKIILTWYHVLKNDNKKKFIPQLLKIVDVFHTASTTTKNQLINYGIPKNKIIIIPLGINLKYFKQYSFIKKEQIRKKLDIPKNKVIIGSSQKDGIGWGNGTEPKLIKGPDILCDVIEKLAEFKQIHIVLTGPARGYVTNRLKSKKISFQHTYLNNYYDIVDYYNVLDAYLVTARIEGGPQSILESWATGVPIISTKVGLAPDLIKNKINGILINTEDINEIAKRILELLNNDQLRQKIIINMLQDVRKYDWKEISKQFYKLIYSNYLR